jgi:hypothetical protein
MARAPRLLRGGRAGAGVAPGGVRPRMRVPAPVRGTLRCGGGPAAGVAAAGAAAVGAAAVPHSCCSYSIASMHFVHTGASQPTRQPASALHHSVEPSGILFPEITCVNHPCGVVPVQCVEMSASTWVGMATALQGALLDAAAVLWAEAGPCPRIRRPAYMPTLQRSCCLN